LRFFKRIEAGLEGTPHNDLFHDVVARLRQEA
jgi:hypothetical protein